jgi:hypothetical protein
MFAARESATNVATELRRTYAQADTSTASLLRTVGYDARAIAGALKNAYVSTGIQVYDALRYAGFATTTINDALSANGIPVGLDCIDQQNNVVPCGAFGGMVNTPVMSQLTWSPTAQGYTDSSLTISGTNIPIVEVRIGPQTLAKISENAGKVVVKLPSQATQGTLKVRRVSDGVEGTLETGYKVVAPPPIIDWPVLATVAITAATEDARHWLAGAKIVNGKCTINGQFARGDPGVFSTATDFEEKVKSALLQTGAPTAVATAWDAAFRAAWWIWANAVTIPTLPWYPLFEAYPGAEASAQQNAPTPLGLLYSTSVAEMSAASLTNRIMLAIGSTAQTTAAATAINSFATTIGTKFAAFQLLGIVTNVQASGTVPTYDPPAMPAGKVIGTCSGLNVLALAANSF